MKEITIEEKAKAYDEAIERANSLLSGNQLGNAWIYKLLPELKESEDTDEKIRKALIKLVTNHASMDLFIEYDIHLYEALTWLEKQSKQKPQGKSALEAAKEEKVDNQNCVKPTDKVKPKFKVGYWICHNNGYRGPYLITNINEHGVELDNNIRIKIENCYDYYHLWTIQDAKDGDVLNSTRVQATIIFKGFAEDGKHINAYCALQSGIFIHQEMLWDRDFEPALKNWKNALFDAMKKADYEWDASEKKLEKIEQKSAWSEEDYNQIETIACHLDNIGNGAMAESLLNIMDKYKSIRPQKKTIYSIGDIITDGTSTFTIKNIIDEYYIAEDGDKVCFDVAHEYYRRVVNCCITEPQKQWKEILNTVDLDNSLCELQDVFHDGSHEYKVLADAIEFIRSNEPQKQWKPSEEQMKALDIAVRCGIQLGTWEEEALKSLKEQLFKLKKLREG